MGKLTVVKVTLNTKKVVLLRELKIRDTEIAAQAVASRANGDANLLQLFMQKELVKNLVVSIDGKELTPTEKEDVDAMFSMGEYNDVIKVIRKLMGGDDGGNEPQIEVVSSGDK